MESYHLSVAMEKTVQIFLFVFIMLFHGLSHGSKMDQADQLRALLFAKMQNPGGSYSDEKWSSMSWDVETSADAGKMEDDLIDEGLLGQPSGVLFKQYAGYISVDESKGRSLFYYFAEAQDNPSSKPLILWLNGGPTCSSLGMGAMLEIGPFGVNPDGITLYARQSAWNKVANTLFVESPAGVGFSYSNTTSDYSLIGDKMTTQDAYTFLVNWFKRYPHYKTRDFYITGESYAGFYNPELADVIMKRNIRGGATAVIQLKGIMIGNGLINDVTDNRGYYDYLWSHALISDETHQGLVEHCYKSNTSIQQYCHDFVERGVKEIGGIDAYNIYAPLCSTSSHASTGHEYDPCEGSYVHSYLNLPKVQHALHANTTKLPYTWETCSIVIPGWKDSPTTMFPIYRRLIASGLRILLYSGDLDAVVPVTGTRYSIDALNLKVIQHWHPWLDDTNEVGGYKVGYDGLNFTTVRGAGHEVPRFQPRRALALLKMLIR